MKHKDKVVHSPSQENVIYCAKKSFSNLNFTILKEKVCVCNHDNIKMLQCER